ncbi:hypothetical protein DL1_20495 [Thioclava dalianensis]|uniref:Sulfotransferase domain-containing protein n=2 Tax=Thioclava dalianensis TaxID=1185766 RepID=A0A074U5R3_9RHOB|nr:hypothetical protein [Thioclava dalianensis]KEP69987.1 hypothetical protein DL1_20495 [Thioclava dalianensis]
MKIIVFFGHHKVGSTALQDFFSKNFQSLLDKKILYPMVDFQGLSLMLAKCATLRPESDDVRLPINAREAHNALAFKMIEEHRNSPVPPFHTHLPHTSQMFHAIRCQINAINPDHVVLISEVMANFGTITSSFFQRLKKEFPRAEFQFIATIRRVDEYLMSWHSQRLRFGHKLAPLDQGGLETYFDGIHFNYQRMIKPWIDAFPEANFVIRNHADVMMNGGSIEDFKVQSGLIYPDNMKPPSIANPSYHRATFELARRANKDLPPESAVKARNFLELITPALELPKSSQIELIGEKARLEMYDRFAPIHDFLGTTIRSGPFFSDFEKVRECQPIHYSEATEVILPQLGKHLPILRDEVARNFFQKNLTQ